MHHIVGTDEIHSVAVGAEPFSVAAVDGHTAYLHPAEQVVGKVGAVVAGHLYLLQGGIGAFAQVGGGQLQRSHIGAYPDIGVLVFGDAFHTVHILHGGSVLVHERYLVVVECVGFRVEAVERRHPPVVVDEPQIASAVEYHVFHGIEAPVGVFHHENAVVVRLPGLVGLQFQYRLAVRLAVEAPQVALFVEFYAAYDDIVFVVGLIGYGGGERTVVDGEMLFQLTVQVFIESGPSAGEHMVGIGGVYVEAVEVDEGIACLRQRLVVVEGPFTVFQYLDDRLPTQFGKLAETTSASIELVVVEFHESEVVVGRSVGVEVGFYGYELVVLYIERVEFLVVLVAPVAVVFRVVGEGLQVMVGHGHVGFIGQALDDVEMMGLCKDDFPAGEVAVVEIRLIIQFPLAVFIDIHFSVGEGDEMAVEDEQPFGGDISAGRPVGFVENVFLGVTLPYSSVFERGIDILSEDGCRGDVLVEVVRVAYLCLGHIELYDAEGGGDIGIRPADVDLIDGFVGGHALAVVGRYIHHLAVVVEQVDVVVVVDDDEPLGRLAVGDMADAAVVEHVHLVVGLYAVVGVVVRVESFAAQYIHLVSGTFYLGDVAIGLIVVPRADGSGGGLCRENDECEYEKIKALHDAAKWFYGSSC